MSNEKEGTSHLVWAVKHKLMTNISQKQGWWKKDGDKTSDKGKLVSRQFVNDMNEFDEKTGHSLKNIYYDIDEKKTDELMKTRDENVIKNAEQRKREAVSQGDLVGALGNMAHAFTTGQSVNATQPVKDIKDMDLKELRLYCVTNDIEYHHASKEAKLIETIEAAQA